MYRRGYPPDKGEVMLITHGVYKYSGQYIRNTNKHLPLPLKFRKLLYDKYLKWYGPIGSIDIDFTVAHDPERDIWAIAIVHPLDHFNRKIGVKIARGRLEKMLSDKPYDLEELQQSKRGLKHPYIYQLGR